MAESRSREMTEVLGKRFRGRFILRLATPLLLGASDLMVSYPHVLQDRVRGRRWCKSTSKLLRLTVVVLVAAAPPAIADTNQRPTYIDAVKYAQAHAETSTGRHVAGLIQIK